MKSDLSNIAWIDVNHAHVGLVKLEEADTGSSFRGIDIKFSYTIAYKRFHRKNV